MRTTRIRIIPEMIKARNLGTVGNFHRAAKPLFGNVSWDEADSVAALVNEKIEGGRLLYFNGGRTANFYQTKPADGLRVIVTGKDWVAREADDKVRTAYQAMAELRGVNPLQVVRLGKFFEIRKGEGSMFISAFEAAHAIDRNDWFHFAPMAEFGEFETAKYGVDIVGAFVDLMLSDHANLGGRLPEFSLASRDIIGYAHNNERTNWTDGRGRRQMTRSVTFSFVFTWCDRLIEVPKDKLADFLIAHLAADEIFPSGSMDRTQQEPVIDMIRAKVARL